MVDLGAARGCGEADGQRKRTAAEVRRVDHGEGVTNSTCSEILSAT